MIKVVENTLRDGSYVVDFQFSKEQTESVVSGLHKLGFKFIEVGHGLGLGAWDNPATGLAAEDDETYISSAKSSGGDATIMAFFIPGIGDEDDLKEARDNGLDFVRIGININGFRVAETYARVAKKLGLTVAINLMKSYAVKSYEFCTIVEEINSWQLADVIYLVDSAGCMLPTEVREYVDRTKQKVNVELGFHGHNNLTLANANSLEAIHAGATYVDSSVRAMGRSAGNAQTEILIWLLEKYGFDTGIDLFDLYEFADNTILPMMKRRQGMDSEEIHIGVSKFHSSYLPIVEQVVEKTGVDRKKLIKATSEINCLDPSSELFMDVAKEIIAAQNGR